MGVQKTIPLKVETNTSNRYLDQTGSKCDASRYHVYSINDARQLFGDRKLYIWGAGQKGRGFWQALNRCGFVVEAFIDSSKEMLAKSFMGIKTISPDAFFSRPRAREDSFVLTASVDIKNRVMFEELERQGFRKGVSYENIQTLSPFYPTIEVTGLCNLRCSGCIRSDKDMIETGKYMSYVNYELIITKLVDEIPFLYLVDLYVYGEPVLNKDLPKIINLNNKLGLASGLSTNLNSIRHIKAILDEYPVLIRVSLSGASSATYDITHTGGRWNRVSENLQILATLIEERGHQTIVEIYFHIYKHNQHEINMIKNMCVKYRFRFHPSIGIVLSSDFALQHSSGMGVPEGAKVANELTLIPMESLLDDCRRQTHLNCILTRVVPVINWDLSVMPCCNYTYSKIAPNYLDISLDEIIRVRTHSAVCATCQSHALHRWNNQGYYSGFVSRIVEKMSTSHSGETQADVS